MCPSLIGSFSDMMQGDNGKIKEVLETALLITYLVIYLIYCCIIVFCLYNEMVLYNNSVAKELPKYQNFKFGMSPHNINSTQDFVEQVKSITLLHGECLSSYDVSALFT